MATTVTPPQAVSQGTIAAEAVAAGLTNPAAASHIIAPITPTFVPAVVNPAAQAAEDAAAAANRAAILPTVSGGTPFNIPAGNPVFTVPGNPNVIDYNAERTWFETQYGKDPLGILSPSATAQPGSANYALSREYYTLNPSQNFINLTNEYAAQQGRTLTSGIGQTVQPTYTASQTYDLSSAAGIAAMLAGRSGSGTPQTTTKSLLDIATAEGYTGSSATVSGMNIMPTIDKAALAQGAPLTLPSSALPSSAMTGGTLTLLGPGIGPMNTASRSDVKVAIDQITGEISEYAKDPWGNYSLIGGVSRYGAQSGEFSVTNAAGLNMNLESLSNFATENISKAQTPGANIPWYVSSGASALMLMNQTGIIGSVAVPGSNVQTFTMPTQVSESGVTAVSTGIDFSQGTFLPVAAGTNILANSPEISSATRITQSVSGGTTTSSKSTSTLVPSSFDQWVMNANIPVISGALVATSDLLLAPSAYPTAQVASAALSTGNIFGAKWENPFESHMQTTTLGTPYQIPSTTTVGTPVVTTKTLPDGTIQTTTTTQTVTSGGTVTPVTTVTTSVPSGFQIASTELGKYLTTLVPQSAKDWYNSPTPYSGNPFVSNQGAFGIMPDYTNAFAKGAVKGVVEDPLTAVINTAVGVGIAAIGGYVADFGAGVVASTAGSGAGTQAIAGGANFIANTVIPPVLMGLYGIDVAGRTTNWGQDFSTNAATRLGTITSTEAGPMILGGELFVNRGAIANAATAGAGNFRDWFTTPRGGWSEDAVFSPGGVKAAAPGETLPPEEGIRETRSGATITEDALQILDINNPVIKTIASIKPQFWREEGFAIDATTGKILDRIQGGFLKTSVPYPSSDVDIVSVHTHPGWGKFFGSDGPSYEDIESFSFNQGISSIKGNYIRTPTDIIEVKLPTSKLVADPQTALYIDNEYVPNVDASKTLSNAYNLKASRYEKLLGSPSDSSITNAAESIGGSYNRFDISDIYNRGVIVDTIGTLAANFANWITTSRGGWSEEAVFSPGGVKAAAPGETLPPEEVIKTVEKTAAPKGYGVSQMMEAWKLANVPAGYGTPKSFRLPETSEFLYARKAPIAGGESGYTKFATESIGSQIGDAGLGGGAVGYPKIGDVKITDYIPETTFEKISESKESTFSIYGVNDPETVAAARRTVKTFTNVVESVGKSRWDIEAPGSTGRLPTNPRGGSRLGRWDVGSTESEKPASGGYYKESPSSGGRARVSYGAGGQVSVLDSISNSVSNEIQLPGSGIISSERVLTYESPTAYLNPFRRSTMPLEDAEEIIYHGDIPGVTRPENKGGTYENGLDIGFEISSKLGQNSLSAQFQSLISSQKQVQSQTQSQSQKQLQKQAQEQKSVQTSIQDAIAQQIIGLQQEPKTIQSQRIEPTQSEETKSALDTITGFSILQLPKVTQKTVFNPETDITDTTDITTKIIPKITLFGVPGFPGGGAGGNNGPRAGFRNFLEISGTATPQQVAGMNNRINKMIGLPSPGKGVKSGKANKVGGIKLW